MKKIIAIMQPTYIPWMGYFSMIDQVDKFVFLDSVQLSGRSWQVRNKIKSKGQEKMLTVPIDKSVERDKRIINTTPYANEMWKKSHLGTIRDAYRKSPFYKSVMGFLENIYSKEYRSVGDMNIAFISEICKIIGIQTRLYTSGNLMVIGRKDELLVNICKRLKCENYLSAQGSAVYIEKDGAGGEFLRQGIELFYFNYEHPVYTQQGENFIPYLGIYDLLFNVGFDEALNYIRTGNRENYRCEEYRKSILHI